MYIQRSFHLSNTYYNEERRITILHPCRSTTRTTSSSSSLAMFCVRFSSYFGCLILLIPLSQRTNARKHLSNFFFYISTQTNTASIVINPNHRADARSLRSLRLMEATLSTLSSGFPIMEQGYRLGYRCDEFPETYLSVTTTAFQS